MEESSDLLVKRALDLWNNFKDEILYKNRFIVEHSVLDYVKAIAKRSTDVLEKNTILYRARIFTGDNDFISYLRSDFNMNNLDNPIEELHAYANKAFIELKQKSGFWGYNADDSFVPNDNNLVGDGRTNPAFITYLYTAKTPYTALAEVRPYIGAKISVAEILNTEELVIADFSYQGFRICNTLDEALMYYIMSDFSRPVNTNKKDYIPTQYIAEYLKKLGYDGIKFNSSLDSSGYNITIFNYNKCKAISSKLYEIKDICIDSECIAPLNECGLAHTKLKPYKNELIKKWMSWKLKNKES